MIGYSERDAIKVERLAKLNRREVVDIFIQTLTDIYNVKAYLLEYLPQMSQKAQLRELRLAILDTGIDIHGQLLRINMVIAMLKDIDTIETNPGSGIFNLNSYIRNSLKVSEDYETDVAMLTHLLIIEGIQISTFTLMGKMSWALHHQTIRELIQKNLSDSIGNKRVFDNLMDDYLM